MPDEHLTVFEKVVKLGFIAVDSLGGTTDIGFVTSRAVTT